MFYKVKTLHPLIGFGLPPPIEAITPYFRFSLSLVRNAFIPSLSRRSTMA